MKMELLRPRAGSERTQRAAKPLQPLLQWSSLTWTGHWFLSSGSLHPCCLNCSSGHSLTPNSLCLGEDRRGCGFLFSLGLFTDFIGSAYGALLYRLKPAPRKAVSTGKEGGGRKAAARSRAVALCPGLAAAGTLCRLFPSGLCPVSSPCGTAQATGREGKQRIRRSIIDNDPG